MRAPLTTLQEIHEAIIREIKAQKKRRRSLWLLIDKTEVLDERPGQFIYRLTFAEELRVVADSTLTVKVPGREGTFDVQVVVASEQALVVRSEQPLPQQMAMVRIEFDPTFILKKLDEHLDQVLRFPPEPLKQLISGTVPTPETDDDDEVRSRLGNLGGLNHFQIDAVVRMQSDSVHLLWGPPGTGKTHTIGRSISEHIRAGKTVLLLSTSNAAVDEMVRATGRALGTDAVRHIFRTGVSPDREIQPFTCIGLLQNRKPDLAETVRQAEQRLQFLTTNLPGLLKAAPNEKVFEEIQWCKDVIKAYVQQAKAFADSLTTDSQCVAATMASLVVSSTLSEREFDVVYIDEASMVSLPFALAGAAQASEQVIVAGDFRQLPPICHSDEPSVRQWFGRNLFDYLGVSKSRVVMNLPTFVSMLREQYRMTELIAAMVSDLSYGGTLVTNEGIGVGTRPVFIDISEICPVSLYSVQECSYYQPHTVTVMNAILATFAEWLGPNNLILSPFRAQRSLLEGLAKDVSSSLHRFSASTIHKAQGAQEHTVIVDLTAHSSDNPQKFFTGDETENLINVALSRAQQNLIVLGSTRLIQTLAASNPYWALFWGKVKNGFIQVPIRDVIADVPRHPSVVSAWESLGQPAEHAALPSLYVESTTAQCPQNVRDLFSQTHLGSKLIVTARGKRGVIPRGDGLTYREAAAGVIPQLAAWQGYLALPVAHDEWAGYRVPETTKRIAAIACGHLFQAQFEISDTHRLLCPKCSHCLLLKASFETAFLRCSGEFCDYSRSMSDQDANTLIEVQGLTCPDCGARPQPRRAGKVGSIFLGCSNYPRCEGKVRWRDYADQVVR